MLESHGQRNRWPRRVLRKTIQKLRPQTILRAAAGRAAPLDWRCIVFTKILIPTDGSDLATAGAMRALHLAKSSGASLLILYVQSLYPYTGIIETVSVGVDEFMAAGRADGMRATERIAAAAKEQGV